MVIRLKLDLLLKLKRRGDLFFIFLGRGGRQLHGRGGILFFHSYLYTINFASQIRISSMKPYQSTDTSLPNQNKENFPSFSVLASFEGLSDGQLIEKLYGIVDEQERKIAEFNALLRTYLDKIKGVERKYEDEKTYSKEMHEKLEGMRNQNYRLKVQIGLVKSDNLILKSKLGYQEQTEGLRKEDRNRNEGNQWQKQNKIKSLQAKMQSIRKIMKQLMRALEKIIINNEDQQNQILNQITELMNHIK